MIHRGWTNFNYYFCVVRLGQACSVLIIFTTDRDYFVSDWFTHMPEICLSGMLEFHSRDIVIKSLHEVVFINMEENDEATFVSNLFVQFFSEVFNPFTMF